MVSINFSTKTLMVGSFVTILIFLSGPFGYKYLGMGLQSSLIAVLIAVFSGVILSISAGLFVFKSIRNSMVLDRNLCLISLVVSLLPLTIMTPQIVAAVSVPPIHDISTDTQTPPSFVEAKISRRGAQNDSEYGNSAWPAERLAAATLSAYPELRPINSSLERSEAVEKSREVLQSMGLEIISVDFEAGRVEAVETSFWFGFKDDIVVRVQEAPSGVRIDIRSKSRVGQSDLGVNAKRVSAFTKKFTSGN